MIKIAFIFVTLFAAFFIALWADHTHNLKERLETEYAEYQKEKIDWSSFDSDMSKEEARELYFDTVSSMSGMLFPASVREKEHEYKYALANFLGDTNSSRNASQSLERVVEAQEQFHQEVEKVLSNFIYFMSQTL